MDITVCLPLMYQYLIPRMKMKERFLLAPGPGSMSCGPPTSYLYFSQIKRYNLVYWTHYESKSEINLRLKYFLLKSIFFAVILPKRLVNLCYFYFRYILIKHRKTPEECRTANTAGYHMVLT